MRKVGLRLKNSPSRCYANQAVLCEASKSFSRCAWTAQIADAAVDPGILA